MSEDTTSSGSSWSMRGLKRWLSTAPETRDELIKLLHDSHQFLEPDTVDMLEGVLDLPATQVREIMTPRTQVIGFVDNTDFTDLLAGVVEATHSRYPVYDSQDQDAVIGILLAKDLIPVLARAYEQPLTERNRPQLTDLLRQPLYISENARSDTLLRLLQQSQVHMAIVIDEFGNMAGVVTLEDLLEEIVGDIVDEHDDFDEDSDYNNILPHPDQAKTWLVQATTPIEDCNDTLGTSFEAEEVDTMGGLVMQALGSVNQLEGQSVSIDAWLLTILEADGRMIKRIQVQPPATQADDS